MFTWKKQKFMERWRLLRNSLFMLVGLAIVFGSGLTVRAESGTYLPYEGAKYALEYYKYYKYSDNEGGYYIEITGVVNPEEELEDWGRLVIPDEINGVPVTSIGRYAFSRCSGLTGDLVLPSGLTSIGYGAFYNCSGLTGELKLPSGLTSIGSEAFYNCSGLTGELKLPSGLTSIGSEAFYNCSGLTGELVLPSGLTSIGYGAFYNCSGLTGELKLPSGLTSIGPSAFSGCSGLTGELKLPSGLASIGSEAFYNCSGLTGELVLPSGLASIGDRAFSCCSGLTGDLTIPKSVTSWGEDAFRGCSFQNVTIGASEIPDYAFGTDYDDDHETCKFAGTLTLEKTVTEIGYSAFYGCSGLTGDLVLPSGLTEIGYSAFYGCSGLTGDLVLPSGLTSIGSYAFSGCSGLTGDLVIPKSVTFWGDHVFEGCSFRNLTVGASEIPDYAFGTDYDDDHETCKFAGTLTLEETVTEIGSSAFSGCSGLTGDLVLPSGLTSIGYEAFSGCSGLTGDLVLPSGLTSIGYKAFSGCSGLTGDLVLPSGLTSIGRSAFSGCSGLTGDLIIPKSVTSWGRDAFEGCNFRNLTVGASEIPDYAFGTDYDDDHETCKFAGTLTLEETVTEIGRYAFSGCSGLTGDLELPSGLTSIGESAFSGCSGPMGDLIIPKSVTSWEGYAFGGCSFQNVTIGASKIPDYAFGTDYDDDHETCKFAGTLTLEETVTEIGRYAFSGCSGLTGDLIIPKSVTSWEGYAFGGCSFQNVTIGASKIPDYAFGTDYDDDHATCKFAGTLTLEETVTSIGKRAFCGCSGLTGDLIIPKNVTSWGGYAFAGCSFQNVTIGASKIPDYAFGWYDDDDNHYHFRDDYERCEFTGKLTLEETVTSIGAGAFEGCSDLTGDINLPSGLTKIGWGAFRGCSGLTGDINLPSGLTSIGGSAFSGCSGLTGDINLPSGLTSIGESAFSGCSGLTGDLVIPKSVTSWGSYAFDGCTFQSLTIGASEIPDHAFGHWSNSDCNFAGKLTLEEMVMSIGEYAFSGCSGLTGDINLPSGLTSIGRSAFSGCSGLTGDINLPSGLTSIGRSAFSGCSGLTGELKLPSGLTEIEDCVFYNCSSLTGLNLPSGLTSIGGSAFNGCSGLNVVIPKSVTSIGNVAFNRCNIYGFIGSEAENYVKQSENTWYACTFIPLDTVTYEIRFNGNGATGGAMSALTDCQSGTSYALPANEFTRTGHTFIGWNTKADGSGTAYADQASVENLAFVNGTVVILYAQWKNPDPIDVAETYQPYEGAKYKLKYDKYSDNEGGYYIEITGVVKPEGEIGRLVIPEEIDGVPVTSIGDEAFVYCRGLTGELTLPSGLRSIGDGAFWGCSGFTGELKLPSGLTSIGDHAFEGCTGLTGDLTIPKSVTSWGERAFNECSFQNVTIGASEIPDSAFSIYLSMSSGCKFTGKLTLEETVTSIGSCAFSWCSGLTGVTLPSGLKSIGDHAFEGCTGLTGELKLPSGLKSIGTYAFFDCIGLNVVIPKSVTLIGNVAFNRCNIYGFIGSEAENYVKRSENTVYACTFIPLDTVTYEIRFDGNEATGGAMSALTDCQAGTGYALPANGFTRTGYTFNGWNTKADGSGTAYADQASVENLAFVNGTVVILYAQWKNPDDDPDPTVTVTYEIRFNGNGATEGSMDALTKCEVGTNYALPTNGFTRTGYTFTGWNTKADGSGTAYADRASVKDLAKKDGAVVTLYAQWKKNSYSIAFKGNGATEGEMNTLTNRQVGTSYTLPANKFIRTGYTFTGWNTKADGSGTAYADKSSVKDLAKKDGAVVTLYAQWKANSYSIAFKGNGSTEGEMSTLTNRKVGTSYTLPANKFKRTGYTFSGWNTKKDGSGTVYANKASVKDLTKTNGATVTLYAQWKKNSVTYQIKFNGNGGTGKMSALKCKTGKSYKLPANAFKKQGYTFAGWNTKKDGKGKSFKNKASVKDLTKKSGAVVTLYAQWKPNTYTVKFDGNKATGGKMKDLENCQYGKSFKLTKSAYKRKGYTFAGWNTKKNGTGKSYKNGAQVKNLTGKNKGTVVLYAQWIKKK